MMDQSSENVLRNSLNQLDRERRRGTLLLFALLLMSVVFWLQMCFAKDDHKGLPFGLAAVMVSAYVAGMISAKTSHDNTRRILKAIELLAADKKS